MTVASFNVPLSLWSDNRYRSTAEDPEIEILSGGESFGEGPNVVLFADFIDMPAGGTAALTDALIGEFTSSSYNTGLLPKLFDMGGVVGIGIREGGTNAATNNRLTGFVTVFDPHTDRLVAYDMAVPAGRHFSGATAPESLTTGGSTLKGAWDADDDLDDGTKADLVMPSWNGSNWVVGGNQAMSEAGGTPNSMYLGGAFDFGAWNGHLVCQIAGTPDPFVDNGFTEALITTSGGTSRNVRTSVPTFNSANSSAAQYTHFNFPAWSGSGSSQDLTQHLYSYIYRAIGPNCRARAELLNSATYLSASKKYTLPPTLWSADAVRIRPKEARKAGMTHICVTRANGNQTFRAL